MVLFATLYLRSASTYIQKCSHIRVVVDDKHNGCVFSVHLSPSASVGTVKWKLVPPPEFAVAQSRPPSRIMVLLAATTGLRRSELFALKWNDIDFSNATLNVSRAIYAVLATSFLPQ